GKSRKRAAAQLGWSENAVRFQLEAGRSRLRARLARRGLPLTGAVLTALLADRASAAVPTTLTETTIQAALLPTAEAAVQGLISNSCSLLTQGALPTVWTNKIIVLGMVALLCLGTAVHLAGVGVLHSAPPAAAPVQADAKAAGPKLLPDLYGDLMPFG